MSRRGYRDRMHALLALDDRWWYALDLSRILGRGWGQPYTALADLERTGCVETRWEPAMDTPHPRRQYRLIRHPEHR